MRNAKLKYAGNVHEPESRYTIIAGLLRLQLVPDAVIRSRCAATRVNEVTRPQSNRVGLLARYTFRSPARQLLVSLGTRLIFKTLFGDTGWKVVTRLEEFQLSPEYGSTSLSPECTTGRVQAKLDARSIRLEIYHRRNSRGPVHKASSL